MISPLGDCIVCGESWRLVAAVADEDGVLTYAGNISALEPVDEADDYGHIKWRCPHCRTVFTRDDLHIPTRLPRKKDG